jgi:hypothetical protein
MFPTEFSLDKSNNNSPPPKRTIDIAIDEIMVIYKTARDADKSYCRIFLDKYPSNIRSYIVEITLERFHAIGFDYTFIRDDLSNYPKWIRHVYASIFSYPPQKTIYKMTSMDKYGDNVTEYIIPLKQKFFDEMDGMVWPKDIM